MFCTKLNVVDCSYKNFNWEKMIHIIGSVYINLHELICSYEAKNDEKLKQFI
jgi:hypothetical protein